MKIWALFEIPEGDCHQHNLKAWWQEQPTPQELCDKFAEHPFISDGLTEGLAIMICSGAETKFDGSYWYMKSTNEGWQ